jgi:hypothetical protein
MQKLLYTLICILLLNGLILAQTFDLQFIEERNDSILGGDFDVRVQIRSVGSTFNMGTSNLVFSYNTTGLTFEPDSITTWNFNEFIPPGSFYTPMTLTQPLGNLVSVNIILASGAGTGQTVTLTPTWMDVVTVHFTIADPSETSNCVWRTAAPNRTNVFDDQAIPLEISSNTLNPLDVSLPVNLTSFTAYVTSDLDVTLTWVTESEINNQGFEVYRCDEEEGTYDILSSYTSNDDLVGQGNSSSKHTYKFTDKTVMRGNAYWYKISDVDVNGVRAYHGPLSIVVESGNVAGGEDLNFIPDEFQLSQNFPNPFNPQTRIKVGIPDEQDIGEITITIYDIVGKKVKTLFKGNLDPGIHTITWNGSDASGKQVSCGTYFYYLKSNKFHQIKKMLFIK